MKVVLHTGKKNLYGLNGMAVSVKEIVDRRVSVVVPQSLLAPNDRRGTAETRTIDFVPSDIQEYVGTLDFSSEAKEELASVSGEEAPAANTPDLFTQEAAEGTEATATATEDAADFVTATPTSKKQAARS
jgi:hypothetical protein